MPLETVRVLLQTDEVSPQPVNGVGVRVFSSGGVTLLTSGTSGDADPGEVEFTLDGSALPGTEYVLRFYILGGSIQSPQRIRVISPPGDAPTGANNFEVEVSSFALPTSPHPRLCRVSGYVLGPSGAPLPGVDMHFVRCPSPISLDGSLVLGERVAQRSNQAGWFELDLIRGSAYYVIIDSMIDRQREVTVPDVAGIRLSDLLFPTVRQVSFSPAGPWSLAEGATLEIFPEVLVSDYRVLDGAAPEDVVYTIGDASVVGLSVCSDRLVLTGQSPGVTTLTVTRRDTSIQHVPDDSATLATISVTVT